GVETSLDRERGAAEVADGKTRDLESAPIELHVYVGVPRLDAGDRSTTGLERERAFARPFEDRVGEHPVRQRIGTIEVDVGRAEPGLDARRLVAVRPGIGETSPHHHAVDFGSEAIDRDSVAAKLDVALRAQTIGSHDLRLDAIAQPGGERARIARL